MKFTSNCQQLFIGYNSMLKGHNRKMIGRQMEVKMPYVCMPKDVCLSLLYLEKTGVLLLSCVSSILAVPCFLLIIW